MGSLGIAGRGRKAAIRAMTAGLCLAGAAAGDSPSDGVYPDRIVFGQTSPLQGPARALGEGMRSGVLTAFHEINENGGVHGRRLELISLDDGYEPEAAAVNAWNLLNEEKVFALIGCVGTPTTRAVRAVARHTDAPIIGPFTGAASLRNPPTPGILNVRASYAQELERIAAEFVDVRGLKRIACLYQNDAFGLTCLEGLEAALARRNMTPAAIAPFERNTTAVKAPFLALRRAQPDAIVLIGTYKPCAQFIRLVGDFEMENVALASVSFIGVEQFAAELGPAHAPCYVTQVVPNPFSDAPVAAAFRAAAERRPGAVVSTIALEGYVAGHFAAAALQRAGPGAARADFAGAALAMNGIDFHGLSFALSPEDNQALDEVYLAEVRGGRVIDAGGAPDAAP